MLINKKRQFQKDFVSQVADCEANFLRLQQLLPEYAERDTWQYDIVVKNNPMHVQFTIIERHAYTLSIEVAMSHKLSANLATKNTFVVRMYLDAQTAEVVDDARMRQLQADYSYPNKDMLQRDEKMQRNRFLAEWLETCLEHCELLDKV